MKASVETQNERLASAVYARPSRAGVSDANLDVASTPKKPVMRVARRRQEDGSRELIEADEGDDDDGRDAHARAIPARDEPGDEPDDDDVGPLDRAPPPRWWWWSARARARRARTDRRASLRRR